jgi:hypothetical protein
LYLSTDDDPANATRIANSKWTNVRDFTKYTTQKSVSINLVANQRYYIEVRTMQGAGNDHFCVRWQLPSGTIETPIPSARVAPFVTNRLPSVSLTSDKATYEDGDDIVLTSTPTDADGSIIKVDFYLDGVKIGTASRSPYSYTYAEVPVGTYAFTARAIDNSGDTSTVATLSRTVSLPVVPNNPPPVSVCATGSITRELWTNLPGNGVGVIPVQNPTTTTTLTALESPSNSGDSYGERIRGYICPPVTGDYTFWVAGDDQTQLWLSTDEDTANKVRIAFNTGWTSAREYTKFASQRSALITLTAGYRYYIEAIHKEGASNDNFSVQWQIPGGTVETPIPGTRLSPWEGLITTGCRASGGITRETWNNISGDISTMDWNRTPNWRGTNGSMEPPRNVNENFAQRLMGFICPPVSGVYTFSIAGDEQAELWLSPNELAANAQKVAFIYSSTLYREFTKATTQSYSVWLSAGRRYYIEARHREVTGTDHLTVQWTLPTGAVEAPIPGTRLATIASGGLREGVNESYIPTDAAEKLTLTLFPNPARESVFISTNQFAGNAWTINLTSHIGAILKTYQPTFTTEDRQTEIRLSDLNLPAGIYILHVTDGLGKTHNLRFVKDN